METWFVMETLFLRQSCNFIFSFIMPVSLLIFHMVSVILEIGAVDLC